MPASVHTQRLAACLLIAAILLSACVPSRLTPTSANPQEPYFRPPAPEATATPPQAQADLPSEPDSGALQPASCHYNLTFLRDVTIPDGTRVSPLSTMDKRWEIENSGDCGWNEPFRLRLIAGPAMGAQTEQALFPARSGTRAVLRILFEAPEETGEYRSAWQAVDPLGEPFGDPVYIDIVVETPAEGEVIGETPPASGVTTP